MSIPGRILQTARSRDLPPVARAAAANLKLLHPDWEYLFFDDADVARFVADEFPQYRAIFEAFALRIQRFDFFRYLAVLRHGGFYFDLDVLLAENLHELTAHRCVFPLEELTLNTHLREVAGVEWELGNYAFGAEPGSPFIATIVENCVRAQTDARWAALLVDGIPWPFRRDFIVLNTTGPGLVTRTYAENAALAAQVAVLSAGDVRDERTWHRFGPYGVHLMEASWRGRRNYFYRRAALWWENSRRRKFKAQCRSAAPLVPALSRSSA